MKINTRVLYTFLTAIFIGVGAYFAIQYSQGNYRIINQGFVAESGLLSANSFPTGAQVLIDGKLATATDDTLYLEPGTYEVEITKDGFSPWKKTLQIEKELVRQTNALLFPAAPSLTPLTFTGVSNISPSPDGQKLIYYTSFNSNKAKNGLYVMELFNNINPLQRGPRQLSEDETNFDLENAKFIWSPDSSEIMIIDKNHEVIIDVGRKTDLSTLVDISLKRKQILSQWEEEMYLREREFLGKFPPEMIEIATTSAKNVYISPDKKRLLYTATAERTIPDTIVPAIPSTNTQPEQRNLKIGEIYIYDQEEDKNFLLGHESMFMLEESKEDIDLPSNQIANLPNTKLLLATDLNSNKPKKLESSPSAFLKLQATTSAQTADIFSRYHTSLFADTYQWFPNSKHILSISDNQIKIAEYDNTNLTTLYSGPFSQNFIYPWPDGSKLIILTSFSPDSPLNLYAIELK